MENFKSFDYETAEEGKYYYHIDRGVVCLHDKPNLCVGTDSETFLCYEADLRQISFK